VSPVAAPEADERVVVDVDLDATVPCTTATRPCSAEAVWAFAHTCGQELTACAAHRHSFDMLAQTFIASGATAACYFCRVDLPSPVPWRAL
jgi:hypothetical protein